MNHLQKIIDSKNVFLFDLDGTLVKTCSYHARAYEKAVEVLTIKGVKKDKNYQNSLYELKKIFT